MATTTRAPQGFTDEDLTKLMALIRGSDSVELKLTVPESDHRSAVAGLDLDPLDAQIRQVVFFDTPDLHPPHERPRSRIHSRQEASLKRW